MWSIVLATTGWIAGWIVFGAPHRLSTRTSADTDRGTAAAYRDLSVPVSVIIPARDEEHSLPLLLGDLRTGAPEGTQVIVVDDQSEDRTREVARADPDVEVIEAGQRPPGWMGKPWACHLGSQAAESELLCFLDADVRLARGALDGVIGTHQSLGGLVSVQPRHLTHEPYEALSALPGVIALMGTGTGRQGRHPRAFGPMLVTEAPVYHRLGGHRAVHSEVVEDMALARRYADAARPVHVFTGGDLVGFRMYPEGIRSLTEGWARTLATGAGSTARWRLAAVVLWLAAMGTASVITWRALSGQLPIVVGLGVFAAFVVQLRWMFHRVGTFGWLAASMFPVLLSGFFILFGLSVWSGLVRGRVRWRGREVLLRADTPNPGA